jgi:hypothetical protein
MPELDGQKSRQERWASMSKACTALSVEMTMAFTQNKQSRNERIIPLCLSFNQADAEANAE